MHTFFFIEDLVETTVFKDLDNEPVNILSQGDYTSVIEFKNNKNDIFNLKQKTGATIALVPNECVKSKYL